VEVLIVPLDALIVVIRDKHIQSVAGTQSHRMIELLLFPSKPTDLAYKTTRGIELLYALIARVCDIKEACRVYRNPLRALELTQPIPFLTPYGQVFDKSWVYGFLAQRVTDTEAETV
jgi:hypothetical protein